MSAQETYSYLWNLGLSVRFGSKTYAEAETINMKEFQKQNFAA